MLSRLACTYNMTSSFSTCLELGEICREVGLPPGVLNIVTGLGPEAGAPLAAHPDVDKVYFSFPSNSDLLLK